MSLLGSQVFANADQAIWLPTAGGVITGNLTVERAVYAGTGVITYAGGGLGGFELLDPSANQVFRLASTTGVSPRSIIQSSQPLYFNQIGTANGNTFLQTSTFGANADVLSVGGTVTAQKVQFNSPNTCGRNTIPVGQTGVVIASTSVTASSIILVTHSGAAAAGPGNGAAQGGLTCNPAAIVPGVSFRVDLVDPATGITVTASVVGVDFNYLVIN